jgi:biopolymer transport protein ExbB
MNRILFPLLIASFVIYAPASAAAQETLDLESLLSEEEQPPVADATTDLEPGDNKTFQVTTDDDITSLEVGDIYKNGESAFKVTAIKSKGSEGGRFSVERIAGKMDPGQSWTRTSGLGPPSIISRETLWDMYLASGMIMHGISFCLLLTIIIGLNSAWIYRRSRQSPTRFVESARNLLEKSDIEGFRDLAMQEKGLFGHICRAMAVRFDISTVDDIKHRCDVEGSQQIRLLRVPLKALSMIAAIAPLLGLLGTVVGMVTCFESVAFEAASASKSQTLASGIRVALFTTAGGLTVAIPALVILFLSNLRLNSVVSKCETFSEQFIHQIAVIKRRESAAGNKENKETADVAELAAATD